eukprot:766822-Hanusia_phi.AAC.3
MLDGPGDDLKRGSDRGLSGWSRSRGSLKCHAVGLGLGCRDGERSGAERLQDNSVTCKGRGDSVLTVSDELRWGGARRQEDRRPGLSPSDTRICRQGSAEVTRAVDLAEVGRPDGRTRRIAGRSRSEGGHRSGMQRRGRVRSWRGRKEGCRS